MGGTYLEYGANWLFDLPFGHAWNPDRPSTWPEHLEPVKSLYWLARCATDPAGDKRSQGRRSHPAPGRSALWCGAHKFVGESHRHHPVGVT